MASLPPGYWDDELLEPGNIDLANRESIPNPQGGDSTVFSESANIDDVETLYPRAADSQILESRPAQDRFMRTGEHLGKFKSAEAAMRYGEMLHEDQAARRFGSPDEKGRWVTPSWKKFRDAIRLERRRSEIRKRLSGK